MLWLSTGGCGEQGGAKNSLQNIPLPPVKAREMDNPLVLLCSQCTAPPPQMAYKSSCAIYYSMSLVLKYLKYLPNGSLFKSQLSNHKSYRGSNRSPGPAAWGQTWSWIHPKARPRTCQASGGFLCPRTLGSLAGGFRLLGQWTAALTASCLFQLKVFSSWEKRLWVAFSLIKMFKEI